MLWSIVFNLLYIKFQKNKFGADFVSKFSELLKG